MSSRSTHLAALGRAVLAGCAVLVWGAAAAAKPALPVPDSVINRMPCSLGAVAHDWNFATGDHGFLTTECDASGQPVWEYGHTDQVPDAPGRVWGTALAGDYPDDSGHGLLSPTFVVDDQHYLLEVLHTFEMEDTYDGANLVIHPYDTWWEPMGGYTVTEISPDPSYTAWCVDGEPGWTGSSDGWRIDCFDLYEYVGMEIAVEFDFGSDASVTDSGWYIARVTLGGDRPDEAACCDPETGACYVTSEEVCAAAGHEWHPETTTCATEPCEELAPPSNVAADTQGPNLVRLSWLYDSPAEDGFQIERREGNSGHWEVADVVPQDVTTWDDASVLEGLTYYYRVRAHNPRGYSDLSNFANAVSGAVPPAPGNVVATATSPVSITLTWTDNSTIEYGFEVQRKKGEFGAWEGLHPNRPANSTMVTNPGVKPDTDYAYRIRAYNPYGKSVWVTSNLCTTPLNSSSFGANIVVKRGTLPVGGAYIDVASGNGFIAKGQTNPGGVLWVDGLSLGDSIRATWIAQSWTTCRKYKSGVAHPNFGMRLWIDSDVMASNGNYSPFVITSTAPTYNLKIEHPIYRFDLAISTEWDIPTGDSYWDDLADACQTASDYLYDVTDGQASLRRIAVWDKKAWWGDADVRIENADIDAHANVDQFMDCDAVGPQEHIYVGRWGPAPSDDSWARTLIHEWGHYGFGLKDEYETGWGSLADMNKLKDSKPMVYPDNFGVMDSQDEDAEMSSRNDYPVSFDYGCSGWFECGHAQTEQLFVNGKSSWDHIYWKLTGASSYAKITRPFAGWFQNGASTSTDRVGPDDAPDLLSWLTGDTVARTTPRIEFEVHDSGPGSFGAEIVAVDELGPARGARVYAVSDRRTMYLGRTDLDGKLDAVGLEPDDTVHIYHRDERGVARVTGALSSDQPRVELRTRRSDGHRLRVDDVDVEAPGAAVDAFVFGTPETPGIQLQMHADEPLSDLPSIICHWGSTSEPLTVTDDPPGNRYLAEVTFDYEDTLFVGEGMFEITLADTVDNVTTFVSAFRIGSAASETHLEMYQGSANLNVAAPDVLSEQLTVSVSSYTVPYRVPGSPAIPVTDTYAFHLAEDDVFSLVGAVNVAYPDSLISGIDETSLYLCRWDDATTEWVALDSSHVSPRSNIVSSTVDGGGLFCVFAGNTSSDVVPPARIEDLGAVPTQGGQQEIGGVELYWTAAGDDGSDGTVQEYEVAYGASPITEETWEHEARIPIVGEMGPAGTAEMATINLPEAGRLYYLAMRAKDEASNLSPISNVTYAVSGVADPNFLPAAPTDFRAVDWPGDDGTAIRLTWELSYDDGGGKDNLTEYRVYRDNPPSLVPELVDILPVGTVEFLDPTAERGVVYTYWVAASDGVMESMSPENRAFSARNLEVPPGDFTSDGIVGVNDLGFLADTYAIDESDPEFDPLFDLDESADIYVGDLEQLADEFRMHGIPVTEPEGLNGAAEVQYRVTRGVGSEWQLDVRVVNASFLAGYAFGVTFDPAELTLIHVGPEGAEEELNMLNRNGGATPVFLGRMSSVDPGLFWIANAIERPSAVTSPGGGGVLARLIFEGATPVIGVIDPVLMDHEKHVNGVPASVAVDDVTGVPRPFLFRSYPNPFQARTTIRFQIPEPVDVSLRIFDVGGRLVRTLVEGVQTAGVHDIAWDGTTDTGLPSASGVYFYKLDLEDYAKARKLIVVR